MTTSDHPFAASAAAANGSQPPSQARLALDNLLRRELRVSDPNDAKAVATALMDRYKSSPRAMAIQSEAQGLPFTTAPVIATPAMAMASSSDGEFDQAVEDVERNLEELTTNSLLTSVLPELRGWANAIRSLIQEGSNSSRFALDVNQRDKTFGIRRSLGDYARMARLVGAATPAVNVNYRKLAQSLDEVAAVLLVKVGEVLANGSFNGGRFIMQAPYRELQARRDAVINALRNLVGSTQQALGPNDWPRGIESYNELYNSLESQGQSDLRVLLEENELALIMDSLIQRAARGEADGMRALGSTAQLDLQRFRRLVIVAQGIVDPESPPLTAFLSALDLFSDAFTPSGGMRLLRVARPAILFYGLYGSQGSDFYGSGSLDRALQDMILFRGELANELDCLGSCVDCSDAQFKATVISDKLLYDVDRAIDLYALGSQGFGLPERRANAYGYIIQTALTSSPPLAYNTPRWKDSLIALQQRLNPDLSQVGDEAFDNAKRGPISALAGATSLTSLSTSFRANLSEYLSLATSNPSSLNTDQRSKLDQYRRVEAYLEPVHQELCIQLSLEDQWQRLLESMAPSCKTSSALRSVTQLLSDSAQSINSRSCNVKHLRIPPNFETALDQLVNNISTKGQGRGQDYF